MKSRYITKGKFYFITPGMPVPTSAFRFKYFDISYKVVRFQFACKWFFIGINK